MGKKKSEILILESKQGKIVLCSLGNHSSRAGHSLESSQRGRT